MAHRRNYKKALFTPQEMEVCRMVAAGMADKEIGCSLNITESTVGYHVRRIFRKLGIHKRIELIRRFAVPEPKTLEEILDIFTEAMLALERRVAKVEESRHAYGRPECSEEHLKQ
jgi:DNA-binding CsgD family transcriptional regulator